MTSIAAEKHESFITPTENQCDDYANLPNVLRDAVKCHFDSAEMPTVAQIYTKILS